MNLIKSFDIFSTKPEFLFENSSRMKTFFGGALTLSVVILMIVLSFLFGLELIQKQKPNIYYSIQYFQRPR